MVKKTYLLWEIKKFGKEITKALNLGLINKKELIGKELRFSNTTNIEVLDVDYTGYDFWILFKFRNKKYNIDVTSDKLKIAKGYIKEDDLTKYELEVILFFLNNLFKNILDETYKKNIQIKDETINKLKALLENDFQVEKWKLEQIAKILNPKLF
jgi:hypothetical protein